MLNGTAAIENNVIVSQKKRTYQFWVYIRKAKSKTVYPPVHCSMVQ